MVDFFLLLESPFFLCALMLFTSEFFTPSLFFFVLPFEVPFFEADLFVAAFFFTAPFFVAVAIAFFLPHQAVFPIDRCLIGRSKQFSCLNKEHVNLNPKTYHFKGCNSDVAFPTHLKRK